MKDIVVIVCYSVNKTWSKTYTRPFHGGM